MMMEEIIKKVIWLDCLYPEGRANCAADRCHPWPQALGCDWWISWRFLILSSGWSIPRVLQSMCGQEPCHQCCHFTGRQWHSGLVRHVHVQQGHILTPLKSESHPLFVSAGVTPVQDFSIHMTRYPTLKPWLLCWRSHPSHMLLMYDAHRFKMQSFNRDVQITDIFIDQLL